ncbi:MAG: hypothetical protein HY549_03510 [Elusimicrobia bacterium]|nr:hypothetical protein [Elusimicrobiota bacterium]
MILSALALASGMAWAQSTSTVQQLRSNVWLKQSSSLLFYDSSGNLTSEIGLGTWEDSSGSRVRIHEIRGGASANGQFSWTLDRIQIWNPPRTKLLESRRTLRFFGTAGKELWSRSEADVPETGEPLLFSEDGKTVVVALSTEKGWTLSVRNYLGSSLMEAGPFPKLQAMAITRNGRFAMAKWLVPDQSASHTFLDIKTKARKDIPSGELYLGLARIDDTGRIFSGRKMIFDFGAPLPETPPTPAPPATREPASSP